jgi:hypothetical protein
MNLLNNLTIKKLGLYMRQIFTRIGGFIMAKFNQGNLVLTSSQKIIQGGTTILDESGLLKPSSLVVSGNTDLSALTVDGLAEINSLEVTGTANFSTITVSAGATIGEFSTDGTLSGDSDTAVPTEKAVKTYVDNTIGTITLNEISQGNSSVVVTDIGTGNVSITVDGTELSYYDDTEQRLGKTAGANITTSDDRVLIEIPSGTVFYSNLSFVYIEQPYADLATRITMSPTNDGYVNIQAGGDLIVEGWNEIQRFGGKQHGTYIEMNQTSHDMSFYHDSNIVAEITSDGVTGAVWG